eukprot:7454479-Ditylum_brightwellii.AAC.1
MVRSTPILKKKVLSISSKCKCIKVNFLLQGSNNASNKQLYTYVKNSMPHDKTGVSMKTLNE